MIYWERPQGGRVFHAGSLGAGWGLSVDPKFQTLMRNVLFHFGSDLEIIVVRRAPAAVQIEMAMVGEERIPPGPGGPHCAA